MKARKWIVLVCGAYLPLAVLSTLTIARSFHAEASVSPRVLRTERQSDLVPPKVFVVTLLAPAQIDGQVLGRGEYTVNWWRDGGSVMLSFAQRDVVQAMAHGEVVPRPEPARYSVVLTRPTASGVNAIAEMQFEGKASVLVLPPGAKPAAAARSQWE